MKHEVKSEFVDRVTGERYSPAPRGEKPNLFKPHDEAQRDRLVAAGVISESPTFDLETKPIEDLTRPEMEEIAVAAMRMELAQASDDDLRSMVARYREHIAEADLSKKTVEQLKEIAEAEDVDLSGITRKDDIIAAIETKRQAA